MQTKELIDIQTTYQTISKFFFFKKSLKETIFFPRERIQGHDDTHSRKRTYLMYGCFYYEKKK